MRLKLLDLDAWAMAGRQPLSTHVRMSFVQLPQQKLLFHFGLASVWCSVLNFSTMLRIFLLHLKD